MEQTHGKLLDWLEEQFRAAGPMADVTGQAPDLSEADAYRLQVALMKRAVARGDRHIGYKAALTSKVMQERAGVSEPVMGCLLASGHLPDGGAVSLSTYLKCAVEPEVGVLLKRDLAGPGVTPLDALAAVEGYFAAIEVVDNRAGSGARSNAMRIVGSKFSGGIVLGSRLTAPAGIDLRLEGVVTFINGVSQGSGTAIEVLGGPLNSVAALANKMAEVGETLRAGMVLMTGSVMGAMPVQAGDHVEVAFTRLGTASCAFTA